MKKSNDFIFTCFLVGMGIFLISQISVAGTVIPTLTPVGTTANGQGAASGSRDQNGQQSLLRELDNSESVKKMMQDNIYPVKDIHVSPRTGQISSGFASSFRLHRNWFLTIGHGPIHEFTPKGASMMPIAVSAERRPIAHNLKELPGSPYRLVIDFTAPEDQKNGKLFLYDTNRRIYDSSNTNRGYDIVLIYVPDKNPVQQAFEKADLLIAPFSDRLASVGMGENFQAVRTKNSSDWNQFLTRPIPDFHLFILSEKTILSSAGV